MNYITQFFSLLLKYLYQQQLIVSYSIMKENRPLTGCFVLQELRSLYYETEKGVVTYINSLEKLTQELTAIWKQQDWKKCVLESNVWNQMATIPFTKSASLLTSATLSLINKREIILISQACGEAEMRKCIQRTYHSTRHMISISS